MNKFSLIAVLGFAGWVSATDASAQQANRGFAAITVSDLAATERWFETHLGTRRLSASRAPSGVAQNVVIGNDYFVFELIHFAAEAPTDTVIKDVRAIGLQKVGVWVEPSVFDSIFRHLTARNATFLGGIITDNALKARTFIVRDNGAVLLQYFAPVASAESGAVISTSGAFFALSVADLDASRKWYEDTLGLKVTMQPPVTNGVAVVVLEGGGLMVELVHDPQATASQRSANPTGVHGFFKAGIVIEDFDATLIRLRARGVNLAFGPFPARGGQRANFGITDNAGNLIQVFGQ